MNLELRRQALEAAGWKLIQLPNGYWSLQKPDGSNPGNWNFFHDDSIEEWENAPAVESYPGASEPWFMEWCAKHKYVWNLSAITDYQIAVWRPLDGTNTEPNGHQHWMARGATPSEARSRVVVSAADKLNARESDEQH